MSTIENKTVKIFCVQELPSIKICIQTLAACDPDGIHGTYVQIKPNLERPHFYSSYIINEADRIILTKYRTGKHYLNIQRGHFYSVDRNKCQCKCKQGIQDMKRVILQCNMTLAHFIIYLN